MPWMSRATLERLNEHNERMAKALAASREREMMRREQVRHLRKSIHRLRSDVGAAVNIAVREAHTRADLTPSAEEHRDA